MGPVSKDDESPIGGSACENTTNDGHQSKNSQDGSPSCSTACFIDVDSGHGPATRVIAVASKPSKTWKHNVRHDRNRPIPRNATNRPSHRKKGPYWQSR